MDNKITNDTKQFLDNHPALDQIEEFLRMQNQFKEIPGLKEISFEKEINLSALKIKSSERQRGILSIELIRIKNQFLYCYRTFETKLNYLNKANIYALNDKNFLVFANNCRGIIEHAASIAFQIKKGNQCLSNLATVSSIDDAMNILKEYHDYLNKLFYGTRFFKNERLVDAIGILSLIDNYLTKELKSIRQFYDFLCDFVHPNFGSNILVTTGELGEGVIDPPFQEKKEIVKQVLSGITHVYEYLQNKSSNFSAIGINIDNFIKKSLDDNIRQIDIFSASNKTFSGNGKSKETAIFFIGAVTPADHIELQYNLLKSKFGIKETNWKEKRIGAMDEHYIYDVHVTTKGEIWFKVPIEK